MRYVPGKLNFPIDFYGFGIMDITVDNAYWIAETKVTYQLWETVYEE